MNSSPPPINVAIVAVPEVTVSTLYGMLDLFSSPGRDWQFITKGEAGEQRMRPYIVARSEESFKAVNGVTVVPDFTFANCPAPDIVCIPDFFVNPGESISGQYVPEVEWLLAVYGKGAVLASACSGAMLFGEAGLLVDCDATIHWGYISTLTNNYPGVRVKTNRSLVFSGEGHRIIMAGGGSSWQDLALYVIAKSVGLKEAVEVAKVYMLEWHDLGQQPFCALAGRKHGTDAIIGGVQEWLAHNYRHSSPIARMVEKSQLSERTFIRRFTKATGMKPIDYVHAVRLEEAKQMLEMSPQAVEAIAEEVGYQDASFFSRLFRRKVGLTPAQYRLRFGVLSRVLSV